MNAQKMFLLVSLDFRCWRVIGALVLVAIASGCATTSSSDGGPEKWVPEKRADAHVDLGLDYLQRGLYDVALEEIDLAISINSRSDRAHHAKGLLSARRGFIDEARKSFAKAVRLNSSNFMAVNDYGIYQCQNGNYKSGISQLSSVEDRQDNSLRTNTLLGLGICHYRQNDFDRAKPYLRSVLNVSPRLPQALLPLADISYRESKFLNARAFIERYISVGARSEQALVLGANTELQLGDADKAKQYVTELRRTFPSSSEITSLRERLNRG